MITLLENERDLKDCAILEIGTGAGYIAHELSKKAGSVASVDIVDDRKEMNGYTYSVVDDEELPFDDQSFDIVITNHVLEHVPDQERHLSEMRRVLRDGGLVYLASPNKWWLTDPHYKLPFISWLPRPISDKYLAVTKGKKWDIYSVSRNKLHKLSKSSGFRLEDRFWDIIDNPVKFDMSQSKAKQLASRLPRPLKRALLHVAPTHLVLLFAE